MSSTQDGCSARESEERCKRLLRSFRVAELQNLLRLYGQPRTGRKTELYQRILNMFRCQDHKQLEERIKHLYSQIQSSRYNSYPYLPVSSSSSSNNNSSNSSEDETSIKFKLHHSKIQGSMKGLTPHWGVRAPYHHGGAHSAVIHPDVKFKELAFYTVVDNIIRPTALVSQKNYSRSNSGHTQDASFQFHLSPQQTHSIVASKTGKISYGVQVQLRICRQETSCPQDDVFPKMCYLRVNGEYTPLPGYYPQLSQKPGYKPSGRPIDITHLVKLSASEVNKFTVLWQYDVSVPQGHVICVDLVRSHSAYDLLMKLKTRGIRSAEFSRALLKQKMSHDFDAEVATTSLRVSLMCPLGKMRMKIPCRSISCNHLQCFDASLYLQMNERKTTWICPVCDRPAPFTELIIDGLFQEILSSTNSNDIEFFQDGSWKPITETETNGVAVCSPEKLLLDNGVHQEDGGTSSKKQANVIDLTLSDSEDEETTPEKNIISDSASTTSLSSGHSSVELTACQEQPPLQSQQQLLLPPLQPHHHHHQQQQQPPHHHHQQHHIHQQRQLHPTAFRLLIPSSSSSQSNELSNLFPTGVQYIHPIDPVMLSSPQISENVLDRNSPTVLLDLSQLNRDSPVLFDNRLNHV
ncbi:E3 SUMO-protein ligase PIAS2-like isoform X2 [Dysidea avara]|uniref:E3 SUMO-protein ligase PIAS2-like isoform X2 n=1 Tax=Dysidea avara TaxID=196820 RepID=UPI00331D13F8